MLLNFGVINPHQATIILTKKEARSAHYYDNQALFAQSAER